MKKTIGQRVKAVRHATGLNQEDFAKEIGVSTSVISKVETDIINITDSLLSKICQRFNINESYFKGDDTIDLSNLKVLAKKPLNEFVSNPWREEAYNLLKSQLEKVQRDYDKVISALIDNRLGKHNALNLTDFRKKKALGAQA